MSNTFKNVFGRRRLFKQSERNGWGRRFGERFVNLPIVRDRVPPRYRPALYFESLYNLGTGAFFALYTLAIVVITTILDGSPRDLALLAAMFGGSSLLSPLVSYCGRKVSMRSLVVYPNLLVAVLLLGTALPAGGARFFTIIVGLAFFIRVFPRVSEMNMYRVLYPTSHRGASVGWVKAVFGISCLVVTMAGYLWILYRPHWYWTLYCLVAAVLVAGAICYSKIPVNRSNVFARDDMAPHRAFWIGLKTFLSDRRFLCFQLGFAIAGTANHMAIVYVAKVLKDDVLSTRNAASLIPESLYEFLQAHCNPIRGGVPARVSIDDTVMVLVVGFIVAVLPTLLMVSSSPLWGRFLDRVNPMTGRSIFNLFQCFAYGFYGYGGLSLQVWPFIVGAAVHAIGNGGGTINWLTGSLYFAKQEHVSLYNAVHVGLTGLRGLVAPLLGAYLILEEGLNIGAWLFWIASGMSLLGAVVMVVQSFSDPGPREETLRPVAASPEPQLVESGGS